MAPGWTAGARVDRLRFSDLQGSSKWNTWDANVTRVEAGVAWSPRRRLSAPRRLPVQLAGHASSFPGGLRCRPARRLVLTGSPKLSRCWPRPRSRPGGSGQRRPRGGRRGAIQGRVEAPRDAPHSGPRPSVDSLGQPAVPRAARPPPQRRLSGERALGRLRGARPEPAVLDQRNQTFLPYVLAIAVGTTVDFPNSDSTYHNVFSLSKAQALRPRPLRPRPVAVRALRPTGRRAGVLRHPLPHERVHPRLRPPFLRDDRRRGALPDRRRARRATTGSWSGTTAASARVRHRAGGRRRDRRGRLRGEMTRCAREAALVAAQPRLPGLRARGGALHRLRVRSSPPGHARAPRPSCGAAWPRRRASWTSSTTPGSRRSRTMARLVADLPKLKAAAADGPPPDGGAGGRRLPRRGCKATCSGVTSREGRVLAAVGPEAEARVADAGGARGARRAGRPSRSAPTPAACCRWSRCPCLLDHRPRPRSLGTLSLGFALDDALARSSGRDRKRGGLRARRSDACWPRAWPAGRRRRSARPGSREVSRVDVAGNEYVALARGLVPGAARAARRLVLRSRTERAALPGAAAHRPPGGGGRRPCSVAVLLSYVVARTVTRPLAEITAAMREIATHRRLHAQDPARPGLLDDEDARAAGPRLQHPHRLHRALPARGGAAGAALRPGPPVHGDRARGPQPAHDHQGVAARPARRRRRPRPRSARRPPTSTTRWPGSNRIVNDVLDFARPSALRDTRPPI